jgi:uncharacterized protein YdaL
LSANFIKAENYPNKKVLILVEGAYDSTKYNYGDANARQLAQLLGHFKTTITVKGVNKYKTHDIDKYDYIFYVGFLSANQIPSDFSKDIFNTLKPVVWLNSGFIDFF